MRSTLLTLILTICAFAVSAQHYTVHRSTQGVTAQCGGKTTAVTKGMSLKASDILNIPEGGSVEILNAIDKRIYRSIRSGSISVTKLLVEARHSATDNLGNLTDHVRFGKSSSGSGKHVYQEKGMVNRSLGVYDPQGGNVEMDPATLAAIIADGIARPENDVFPEGLDVKTSANVPEGAWLSMVNSLDYPVYFNILTISGNPSQVEISPLGQPGGTYVLLKSQSIARAQQTPLPADQKSILVVTPCQFELDTVIDEINRILAAGDKTCATQSQYPVYIRKF